MSPGCPAGDIECVASALMDGARRRCGVGRWNEALSSSTSGLQIAGTGSSLIFVHVPKTGGQSIEMAGASHGIRWGPSLGSDHPQRTAGGAPRDPRRPRASSRHGRLATLCRFGRMGTRH